MRIDPPVSVPMDAAHINAATAAADPPAPGARWPTLQQMIDANRRIVFLAENHGGAAPWYQAAYRSVAQETPYNFKHVKQLTAPAELAATWKLDRRFVPGASDEPAYARWRQAVERAKGWAG